jgi:hypothetical protein
MRAAMASIAGEAPSTALRAVPLPRFAGEEGDGGLSTADLDAILKPLVK